MFLKWAKRGDIPVSEITAKMARQYASWLATEAMLGTQYTDVPRTRRAHVAPLSSAGRWMLENEVLPLNPFAGLRVGKAAKSTNREAMATRKRAYATDELVRLLSVPEKRVTVALRYSNALLFETQALLLLTGLRVGELMGLQADDVEPKGDHVVIHIRAAKSAAGVRSFPVAHPLAVDLFKARRKAALRVGGTTATLWPEFPPAGPNKSRARYLITAAVHMRKAANLSTATDIHSHRRTFISNLIAAGASPIVVEHMVGHQVSGQLGVYAQPVPSAMLAAAKLVSLDSAVERAIKKHLK